MRPLKLVLPFICLLLAGCSSTKQVGDVIYQRVAFPSLFGPYQAIVVSYPVGQTNMQQVVTKDSNVGPGSAVAGAAVQAGGYVAGQAVRRPSKVKTSNSTSVSGAGSNIDFDGGNVNVGGDDISVTGGSQDVHVDAPGTHNGGK